MKLEIFLNPWSYLLKYEILVSVIFKFKSIIFKYKVWFKYLYSMILGRTIPCGEFQWSLEDPVNQIHSPRLHTGAPGIF